MAFRETGVFRKVHIRYRKNIEKHDAEVIQHYTTKQILSSEILSKYFKENAPDAYQTHLSNQETALKRVKEWRK